MSDTQPAAAAPRSYVLYGTMTFNNKARRDSVINTLKSQAAQRGFTPVAWGGYQAGCVAVANTTCTFCYSSTDEAAIEQAANDMQAVLDSNQYDGDFGYQRI